MITLLCRECQWCGRVGVLVYRARLARLVTSLGVAHSAFCGVLPVSDGY